MPQNLKPSALAILKESQRFTPISRIALRQSRSGKCIVRDEKRILAATEHILHERRFADASATCHGNVPPDTPRSVLQFDRCGRILLVRYLSGGNLWISPERICGTNAEKRELSIDEFRLGYLSAKRQ